MTRLNLVRRSFFLVLAALLLALGIAPGLASAATGSPHSMQRSTVTVSGPVSRAYGAAALAGVHYDWRDLGYSFTFTAATRPQRAITDNTSRTIAIYVRPGQSLALTTKVLAYEIGHVVDFTCNTFASRARWLRARHAAGGVHWWAPAAAPEWSYGSGDFADVFSLWATGDQQNFVSTVAPRPSAAQVQTLSGAFTCTPNEMPDFTAP